MNTTVDKKTNKEAILKYGITLQSVVCMEEMSELTKEISKFIRGKGKKENLVEEIADVYICLDMLQTMYNISDKEIKREIFIKQLRTNKRLSQEESYGQIRDNI